MRRFKVNYTSYRRKGSKQAAPVLRIHNFRIREGEIQSFIRWLEDHDMGIRADVVRVAHANALEFRKGEVTTTDVIEMINEARQAPL